MNRNMVIVLAGGFLIAVLVALLVQASLGGKKQVSKAEPPVQIVVAAQNLAVGEVLTDADLKFQEWPKTAVFPGAVVQKGNKKPLELINGRLKRAVAAGEPVVDSALIHAGSGNLVAATLADGMRAVGVDVNATRMAGGFISPGDYVDVILTYKKTIRMDNDTDPRVNEMVNLNLDHYATETILQNVKVMAVDQQAKHEDGKDDAVVGKTVTLEVDAHGAEILALGNEMGTISLSLRKLGDKSIVSTEKPVVTDERLTHISREVYDQAHKITGQGSNIVRIYNGYAVDQTTVNP